MTSFPKIFGERRLGPIAAPAGLSVFQAASAAVKDPRVCSKVFRDRDLSSRHSV